MMGRVRYLSILSNGPSCFKVSVDLSICSMDKIGDGECDSENLVGFCSFDGYDCCNVTESNKTYIGKIIALGSGYSSSLYTRSSILVSVH